MDCRSLVFLLVQLQLSPELLQSVSNCPAHSWYPTRNLLKVKTFSSHQQSLKYQNTTHLQGIANHSLWNLTSPRLEIHMPLLTFPLCSWHYCHLIVLQVYKKCPRYLISRCISLWSLCFTFYSTLYSFRSVFTFVTTFVHSTYLKGSH